MRIFDIKGPSTLLCSEAGKYHCISELLIDPLESFRNRRIIWNDISLEKVNKEFGELPLPGHWITKSPYQTPINVIEELLKTIDLSEIESILEPFSGQGNVIKGLREFGFRGTISSIEVDSGYREILETTKPDNLWIIDFLDMGIRAETIGKYDCIISNPPYGPDLERLIIKCLELLNRGGQLILLVRLGFLAGQRRKLFLEKYKPTEIKVLSNRPGFAIKAIDNCGYCWVQWNKPLTKTNTIINWL